MTQIAVIGAGAWGSALAHVWAKGGNRVILFARDAAAAEAIARTRRNEKYLPGVTLADGIRVTSNATDLADAEHVALVVPAQTTGAVFAQLAGHIASRAQIILCSKGIDRESGLTPWDTLRNVAGGARLSVLSGPSFAADVASDKPTAVTLAAKNIERADALCAALSTTTLRLYANDDTVGVELGGALKNVIALAVGLVRGLNLGASAEAALITRGFSEIRTIIVGQGGLAATVTGLSGLGDLVLTCSSPQSRNFSYGMALAAGKPLEGLPLAEGVHSAHQALHAAQQAGYDAPIIHAVVKVLDREWTPHEAVKNLLARPLRREV